MSVDLYRSDEDKFFTSNAGWRRVIAFANVHGAGWDDTVEQSSEESAKQLAEALTAGLANKSSSELSAELSQILDAAVEFTDDTRAHWLDLAMFANRGAFQIWI